MVNQLYLYLKNSSTTVKLMISIFVSLFLLRLLSLGLYPLFDTTEARYGEIARLMFETQNWVTPQFDYDVPFWGKPPFHTWITAASFNLFGVSEFFARLPHLIVGMLTVVTVYRFTLKVADVEKAILSVFVLTSTLGFIFAIGMVMTDSSLLLAYTLAMTSFWLNYKGQGSKFNGHLFFAALALGMLVKGPVAVVIVLIALVIWSVSQKQFINAIKSLPWKSGFALFWLLVLPWYVWAELRTPGFLEYFVVGEHIQRFLVSGWEGDLYGSAHDKPRGTIWLYWVLCAFPWSYFIIRLLAQKLIRRASLSKKFKGQFALSNSNANIQSYLLAWTFAPLVLFTFAGNILPIYVMPGFAAMAVLVALTQNTSKKHVIVGSSTLIITFCLIIFFSTGKVTPPTEKRLLEETADSINLDKLYYWYKRPFSAQFYSNGKAKLMNSNELLEAMLNEKTSFHLVINVKRFDSVVELLDRHCVVTKVMRNSSLYSCYIDN